MRQKFSLSLTDVNIRLLFISNFYKSSYVQFMVFSESFPQNHISVDSNPFFICEEVHFIKKKYKHYYDGYYFLFLRWTKSFFYCKQQYKISTFSLCVEQMPTEMSSNKLSINLCKISYPTDQSCQIRTLVIFPLSNLQQSGIIGLTSNIRSLVMVSGSNERNLSRSGNSKVSFSQTGCRYISCSLTFEYNTHIILIKKFRS